MELFRSLVLYVWLKLVRFYCSHVVQGPKWMIGSWKTPIECKDTRSLDDETLSIHFKSHLDTKKRSVRRRLQVQLYSVFLDAFSHLYKRVCLSVGPSVRRSVRPSIGRTVRPSHTSWDHAKVPFLTETSRNASYAVYPAWFNQPVAYCIPYETTFC